MSARYVLTIAGSTILLPQSAKLTEITVLLSLLTDSQNIGSHYLYHIDDANPGGNVWFIRDKSDDIKLEVTTREFLTKTAADKFRDDNETLRASKEDTK